MGPSAKAEQKERREIIRSEGLRPGDQPATTFHALANLDTSPGGRFAAGGYVSGSEPGVNYPAGPAWTRDQVGLEPSLGVAIDQMEPTGEAFEIEASLLAAPAIVIPGSETAEDTIASSVAERKGPIVVSPGGDGASSLARLAKILPRLAVPRRRKV
jgi:hypothetical protein